MPSATSDMDYDRTAIPEVYDSGRACSPRVLKQWIATIAAALPDREIRSIVDLGCGTGRYSAALAEHFDADVRAIDPSVKMLEQARRKPHPRVRYECCAGEQLSLEDESVDLVFMSMVFHHLNDPAKVARECRRVLRPGGCVSLRAGSREQIPSYPQARFFERAASIFESVFQPSRVMIDTFENAGLRCVTHVLSSNEVGATWKDFAEKVSYRADSVLARLSDEEFQTGLEALRRYARTQPDEIPVVETLDLFVFQRGESPD